MSSLLVATGELGSPETASKRTADTGVLLFEFAFNKPSSERSMQAIARMNYLHSRYQNAGKISNEDMLYTLSVFALEPVRWINKYEWRSFTDFERCAVGTYWKSMGDAMDISYDALPSHKSGWQDGLHWLEEIKVWSEKYEAEHMIPAESNYRLANAHLDVLFLNIPERFNRVGKDLASVFLGERIRKAMMLPKPPSYFVSLVDGFFLLRKYLLRYFFLPRPDFLRKDYLPGEPDNETGRYSAKAYLSHPWYVKPTFKRRWGLRAWITRLLGRKLPGDDGNRYAPEGYKILEVGPDFQKHKGAKEMQVDRDRMVASGRGGCPFGFS